VERTDTIVVGGGQAGLAMSYHLARTGREHVILERGRVAQSWRSERWDSLMFHFLTYQFNCRGTPMKLTIRMAMFRKTRSLASSSDTPR
jgi:putative flavoprotein involved in K+ transport